MISQKCPVCHSTRIRRGYRPTPFWSKFLFRYKLLCDNCNWEFVGFAIPLKVSSRQGRNVRNRKEENLSTENHGTGFSNDEIALRKEGERQYGKHGGGHWTKKKIKIRI